MAEASTVGRRFVLGFSTDWTLSGCLFGVRHWELVRGVE